MQKCNENESKLHGSKVQESMLFFRTWFECLRKFGLRQFALSIIALLDYAFYGIPVEKQEQLSPRAISTLLTFTPSVDSFMRNRENGQKGAAHGTKGGRPRKGEENPTGVLNEKSHIGNDVDKDVDIDVDLCVDVGQIKKQIPLYLDIFFFKNVKDPAAETERFVRYYASAGWRKSDGTEIPSGKERRTLAARWEIHNDSCNRFNEYDLEMWQQLYKKVPEDLRLRMLDPRVNFEGSGSKGFIIHCSKSTAAWIEESIPALFSDIFQPWLTSRHAKTLHYQVFNDD